MLLLAEGRVVGLVQAELGSVPAVALEVLAELAVLLGNGVLVDIGEAEEGDSGRQQGQGRGDPERILGNLCGVVTTSSLDVGEDPGSDKGTNLANGGGDTVVAATDTGGTGLGSQQTDVVAGAELAKTQEDAVDNGEAGNVLGDLVIDASHDVADNGLQRDTNDEGILGANQVADKGANHGSGDVEQVDDGVPSKDGREGSGVGVDASQDGRGVDAESIRGELTTRLADTFENQCG